MRIICLANSYKHNGRCIAGIDESGRWLRPVSSSSKRAINKETRSINGSEPQLLDILEIPLHAHGPNDGCQKENKLIKVGNWQKVGQEKPKDLLKFCDDDSVILHNNLDYVRACCFRAIPHYAWKSLQLIHSKNVVFEKNENNKSKWQAKFINSKGNAFNLRLTDPVISERLERGEKIDRNCLLTISMAPGWSPDSRIPKRCYKFVAGVVELGVK